MKCPFCAYGENKVIDSRLSKSGSEIRRRRECNDCGKRFTTYERIEEVMPHVVRSDGRREPFDRVALLTSLREACAKRPIAVSAIERTVDDIEKELQETGEKEVDTDAIVEEVLIRLSDLDDIAYVRYAARYRKYAGLSELTSDFNRMLSERTEKRRA